MIEGGREKLYGKGIEGRERVKILGDGERK